MMRAFKKFLKRFTFVRRYLLWRRRRRVEHADYTLFLTPELEHYHNLTMIESASGLHEGKPRSPRLVISLTTYGYRLEQVYLVIENLMQQTVKADEIILWLARGECTYDTLPDPLKRLQKRGLTVNFGADYKAYKKVIHTLRQYPDDVIITVDDDCIYPLDHIEKLYQAYLDHPTEVHCHRAHKMRFNKEGKLFPYREWEWETGDKTANQDLFFTGCGGVIYFPGCFDTDVTDDALFMKLSPLADDVWLNLMIRRKGTLVRVVRENHQLGKDIIEIEDEVTGGLWAMNRTENDRQIKAVLRHYPDISLEAE